MDRNGGIDLLLAKYAKHSISDSASVQSLKSMDEYHHLDQNGNLTASKERFGQLLSDQNVFRTRPTTTESRPAPRPCSWQSGSRYFLVSSSSSMDLPRSKTPIATPRCSSPAEQDTKRTSPRRPSYRPRSACESVSRSTAPAYSPMAAGFARLNKQELERMRQSSDPAAKFFM